MARCDWCGKEFEPQRSDAKFHSDTCRKAAHKARSKQTTSSAPKTSTEAHVLGENPPSEMTTDEALERVKQKTGVMDEKARKTEAKRLYAEANRLVGLQREHRGYEKTKLPDGTEGLKMGPYKPTPETEARADRIIRLRKHAAILEHPL